VETRDEGSAESSNLAGMQGRSKSVHTEIFPVAEMSSPSPPASTVPDSAEFSGEFPGGLASFLDGFADITSPLELLELPKFSAMNNHFTDLLTPPFDIEADSLHVGTPPILQDHRDITNLLISDEVSPDCNSFKSPFGPTISNGLRTPVGKSQDQSSSSDHLGTRSESSTVCRCMPLAMGLLHKLFSPEFLCSSSDSTIIVPDDRVVGNNLSVLRVLEQNKKTIEAVSNMLQCSCTETGYLTIMLSMIVFKVLEVYAVAVQQVQTGASFERTGSIFGGTSSTPIATYSIRQFCTDSSSSDDEGASRTSTQLILGELHHVQGILNQLALRLNVQGVQGALEQVLGSNHQSPTSPPLFNDGCSRAETFSPATLGQMEADLRRGLTTLSSEIITRLRRS
jgi:hypothetical protein